MFGGFIEAAQAAQLLSPDDPAQGSIRARMDAIDAVMSDAAIAAAPVTTQEPSDAGGSVADTWERSTSLFPAGVRLAVACQRVERRRDADGINIDGHRTDQNGPVVAGA